MSDQIEMISKQRPLKWLDGACGYEAGLLGHVYFYIGDFPGRKPELVLEMGQETINLGEFRSLGEAQYRAEQLVKHLIFEDGPTTEWVTNRRKKIRIAEKWAHKLYMACSFFDDDEELNDICNQANQDGDLLNEKYSGLPY